MLRQRARGYIKRREWERVARWEELVHRSRMGDPRRAVGAPRVHSPGCC